MGNDSNTGLMEQAASSGVQQAGGNLAALAVSTVVNLVKKKYGETQIDLGAAFNRYLDNAYERYNHVKTLATGIQPRTIIGKDSIYVSIGVQYKGAKVDTETVEPLLKISKHLVIEGTGGIGKSMLLRYLFLKTVDDDLHVPVLLTLRKINEQTVDQAGKIDLFQLIDTCMAEFHGQLPREQFQYSLESGQYLFLLDGLDEVKQELANKTIEAIQTFCQQYPKNPCIITSRPRQNLMPLETFTVVRSGVLQKAQAIDLASKLDPKNEKTAEFHRQLEEELFEKHKDFAENPLLLGMMFLTFRRTNSIPDHLADFYGKTFEALYSLHDSTNKGTYQREFHCKELNEPSFRNLLAYFCFQSYFQEDYEFSKDSILAYMEKGIRKLGLSQVRAQDYIDDLCDAVCILVEEGEIYRFSHRNFQAYFAACYTMGFSDEQQKQLFARHCFPNNYTPYARLDYCRLMMQLESHRFAINALEPDLRSLLEQADKSPFPDVFFLKHIHERFEVFSGYISFDIVAPLYYIIILAVNKCFYVRYSNYDFDYIASYVRKTWHYYSLSFNQIDSSPFLTDEERTNLYATLVKAAGIPELRAAIRDWLQKLDEERANLQQDDFLESL